MVDLKKGAWSPQEDRRLISYITQYGTWNWSQIPKFARLARTGKSCRLRWINYLRPDVKRGPFSVEEVEIIVEMFLSLGQRWSAIAARLPGRTDNDIKNFYHTHLKKHLKAVNVPATGRRAVDGLRRTTHNSKNNNGNAVMLQLPAEVPRHQGSTRNYKFEEEHYPPLVNVVAAVKPRHDQHVTTSVDSNPDGFGNPSSAHDQEVHHHHHLSSASSAAMDIMSLLSFEDYDEIKSFWYDVLNQAEHLKF